jgi:hypothetical protein
MVIGVARRQPDNRSGGRLADSLGAGAHRLLNRP